MTWELTMTAVALLALSTWGFYEMRDSELSMFVAGATYMLFNVFLLKIALAMGDAIDGFLALPAFIPSTGMFIYAIVRFIEDYRIGKYMRRVGGREEVQGSEG